MTQDISMSEKIANRAPTTGYKGGEIVHRSAADFEALNRRYSVPTEFSPFDDSRVADCYNFLYCRQGEKPKTLEEVKKSVDRSDVNASRLVYASWLHVLQSVYQGGLDWEVAKGFVGEMRKKGDGVLEGQSELSLPTMKQEYMTDNSPVNAEAAISLGSLQMLTVLKDEGVFLREEDYTNHVRAAVVKDKEAPVL